MRVSRACVLATIALTLACVPVAPSEAGWGGLAKLVASMFRSAPKAPRILPQPHPPVRPVPGLGPGMGHLGDEAWRGFKVERAIQSPQMQALIDEAVPWTAIAGDAAAAEMRLAFHTELYSLLRETVRFVPRHSPLSQLPSRSADDVTNMLVDRLERLAAREASQESPRFIFEVASGKLTFPSLYRSKGVEVRGGEINAYKVLSIVAAGLTCVSVKCATELGEWLLSETTGGIRLPQDARAE